MYIHIYIFINYIFIYIYFIYFINKIYSWKTHIKYYFYTCYCIAILCRLDITYYITNNLIVIFYLNI